MVQMRSRRRKKMKKEIRTARDAINHWYKGMDLMRVYQGQLDWDWRRTWSNQILGIWPDSLNVAGPRSFWKAIDYGTGTCFLCIYWIFGIQSVWMLTFLDLEGGGRSLNYPQGGRPWLLLGMEREEGREWEGVGRRGRNGDFCILINFEKKKKKKKGIKEKLRAGYSTAVCTFNPSTVKQKLVDLWVWSQPGWDCKLQDSYA